MQISSSVAQKMFGSFHAFSASGAGFSAARGSTGQPVSRARAVARPRQPPQAPPAAPTADARTGSDQPMKIYIGGVKIRTEYTTKEVPAREASLIT